jgi:hypothetical protein
MSVNVDISLERDNTFNIELQPLMPTYNPYNPFPTTLETPHWQTPDTSAAPWETPESTPNYFFYN